MRDELDAVLHLSWRSRRKIAVRRESSHYDGWRSVTARHPRCHDEKFGGVDVYRSQMVTSRAGRARTLAPAVLVALGAFWRRRVRRRNRHSSIFRAPIPWRRARSMSNSTSCPRLPDRMIGASIILYNPRVLVGLPHDVEVGVNFPIYHYGDSGSVEPRRTSSPISSGSSSTTTPWAWRPVPASS